MAKPKYPNVEVQLSGKDGNAYAIMARVELAMQRAGVPKKERNKYLNESTSGDYDHLLQTAMRWVHIT